MVRWINELRWMERKGWGYESLRESLERVCWKVCVAREC